MPWQPSGQGVGHPIITLQSQSPLICFFFNFFYMSQILQQPSCNSKAKWTVLTVSYFHRGGISVYSPSEGLMPGQSFQDEIADKIKRGCRKTIVIMSPDYIESPWCAYEARLAHHKSPGWYKLCLYLLVLCAYCCYAPPLGGA